MCGVIGLIGAPHAAREAYMGLLNLQHRGQDAAGILTYDFQTQRIYCHKENGLASQVFSETKIDSLKGQMAIGHTRYSTVGRGDVIDIQPLVLNFPFGIGMVHNGNIVNYHEAAEKLRAQHHCQMLTTNDVEVILNIFGHALLEKQKAAVIDINTIGEAVQKVFSEVDGGFSVVALIGENGLVAFRDPFGIRPLVLGERTNTESESKECGFEKSYCVASESVALNFLGFEVVRKLEAGEVIFIDKEGKLQSKIISQKQHSPCMFEWVYFANPESVLDDREVYATRLKLGLGLAKKVKRLIKQGTIQPDIIVPVPETSRISAIALSEELGIPYREVLIKNRYIQRSFILNTPKSRRQAVELKLSPVVSEIKGKRILLVDDSIVRGTTSRRLVDLVRRAGARQVYFASACPPIRHPCFYGIDFPDPKELVATDRTEDQISEALQADSVIYLEMEDLKEAIGLPKLCMACLDGKYPTDVTAGKKFIEKRNLDRAEIKA